MKPGKARSSWTLPRAKGRLLAGWCCALATLLLATGCRTLTPDFERDLMIGRGQAARNAGVAERYTATCPDVLDVVIANHAELSGPHPIGIDGRLDLEPVARPRVEGETIDEIAQQLASLVGLPVQVVQVRVQQYRSQCVFLFGEVKGLQRAVPYQGQETVVDLLRRTGGITAGAAPRDCYVVRTHVGDAKRPEVFHVDLQAIVAEHDARTNLRLQPYDQVHVGGTRRAGLEKCVPPWLRPLYQRLCAWVPLPDPGRAEEVSTAGLPHRSASPGAPTK
jgi:protein involved in polysaccharide export with SLBB domain